MSDKTYTLNDAERDVRAMARSFIEGTMEQNIAVGREAARIAAACDEAGLPAAVVGVIMSDAMARAQAELEGIIDEAMK